MQYRIKQVLVISSNLIWLIRYWARYSNLCHIVVSILTDEDLILFVSGLAHHITAGINVLISVWLLAAKGHISDWSRWCRYRLCLYWQGAVCQPIRKVKLVLAQYLIGLGLIL